MMTIRSKGIFSLKPLAALTALMIAAPSAWAQGDPAPPPAAPPPPPGDAAAPPPPGAAPNAGAAPAQGPVLTWNAQADTGAKPAAPHGGEPEPKKLPWRLTTFGWDHSTTTETVGIGQETQSRNPTYEMSFVLLPRYYIWEGDAEGPEQNISIRARLDLIREFTNSDTTTERGEWTFSDLSLFPQYTRNLYKEGDVKTDFGLRVPVLTFPTSKVSANNGTVLGLGAMVMGIQQVPVMGTNEPVLRTFSLTGRAGYTHTFTEATEPTNDDLNRVRLGPDGRSLPGGQLSGAAFAQHKAAFDLIGALAVTEQVTWTNWLSWQPAWKYKFEEAQEVCIATGCTTVGASEDSNNFAVVTLFNTEVAVEVIPEFEVDVGYANLTLQTGPDGTRRNIFYSPDARVYITLVAHLDEIYKTATGYDKSQTATGSAARYVAGNKPVVTAK